MARIGLPAARRPEFHERGTSAAVQAAEATAAPRGGNKAAEEDGQTENALHRDDSNADWEEGVRD
jgi:hypothetical protein